MADSESSDDFESEEDVGQHEQGAEHSSDGNSSDVEKEEDEVEPPMKKKKGQNLPRDWKEVNRWQRADYSDEDIDVFIRKELDDLNRSAGILAYPGAHKNRNNKYGDFQYRRQWQSNNGRVLNNLAVCPLKDRCCCPCEAKIVHTELEITLYLHMAHSAQDHVPEKDRGKFLKFTQKAEIAHAVKVAPLQNASDYLRNVQDSPTKAIDHKYKSSVARLQRKQRKQIIAVTLDGVTVDNTVGSLAQLAEKLWICVAIHEHEVEGRCMDLFKTYVIGKQILDQDRTVFLTFANLFDVLNLWRACGTGFSVQLQGDCTQVSVCGPFSLVRYVN